MSLTTILPVIQFKSSTNFKVKTLPVLKKNLTTETTYNIETGSFITLPILKPDDTLVIETTITSVDSKDDEQHGTFHNHSPHVLIYEKCDGYYGIHIIPSRLVQSKDHDMLERLTTPRVCYNNETGTNIYRRYKAVLAFKVLMNGSLPPACGDFEDVDKKEIDKEYNETIQSRQGEWTNQKVSKVDKEHPITSFYTICTDYS